jgi:hypothetical protein
LRGGVGRRLDIWLVWVVRLRLRGAPVYALDFWVVRIESIERSQLWRRLLDGVGEVRVFAGLGSLEDAQGVVLCVLGLGRDLGVVLLPY